MYASIPPLKYGLVFFPRHRRPFTFFTWEGEGKGLGNFSIHNLCQLNMDAIILDHMDQKITLIIYMSSTLEQNDAGLRIIIMPKVKL